MKFIAMIVIALSASGAFASEYVSRKMSFSPMTNSGWNRTYYSCDWAENQAERHLKAMGAQNVRVTCTGGIDYNWVSPIFVRARFDAPVPAENDVTREVVLKGNDGCSFSKEFIGRAVKLFPGVKVKSHRGSCMGGRMDSWRYVLSVTE